jgi:hypothetical protein
MKVLESVSIGGSFSNDGAETSHDHSRGSEWFPVVHFQNVDDNNSFRGTSDSGLGIAVEASVTAELHVPKLHT